MGLQVGNPATAISAAQLLALRQALGCGSVLASGSPNQSLNDTGIAANTAQAFPTIITIPGGTVLPSSKLRLTYALKFIGANAGRDVLNRIGQAATATFSTATPIGGQSGLSNQVSAIYQAHIFMAGSLTAQRSTPANNSSVGAGTNAWVVTALDFALDVNIWLGVKFPTLSGGDSAQLQDYVLELLP